jgi:tagaturonate reductase
MSTSPSASLPKLNAAFLGSAPNHRPERILQFGEGGFLRGFVDWMIHRLNQRGLFEGSVVVVQPLATGLVDELNRQNGFFTQILRGVVDGEVREEIEIVRSIRRGINPFTDFAGYLACARNPDLRFIVSNTTEAGIACHPDDRIDAEPPVSFPAKLTRLLLERHHVFGGSAASGLVVLPCELIEFNGTNLRRCVLETAAKWKLDDAFVAWVDKHVVFCNTLVDRIVTGYPRDEAAALCARLGYEDALLNTSELFHAWVIEGPASLADELPFAKAGLDVVFTSDYKPYRDRKVRILNGAHTATVLAAHLAGHDLVKQMLDDALFAGFLRRALNDEIIPTLDLPRSDLDAFAAAVLERFANPFVKHALLSISLNSTSKFTARVLPSLQGYLARRGALPPCLVFSLAALIAFYRGTELRDGALIGRRPAGDTYPIKDNPEVLAFFREVWSAADTSPAAVAKAVLAHTPLWGGQNLDSVPGLAPAVAADLAAILGAGVRAALQKRLLA